MPNPDGSNGHAAPPLEQVRVEVADDEQRDLRMESDAFMQSLDSYHRLAGMPRHFYRMIRPAPPRPARAGWVGTNTAGSAGGSAA